MKKFSSLAKYIISFFILGFAFLISNSQVQANQAELIKIRSGSSTTRFIVGPKFDRFNYVLPKSEIVASRTGNYAVVVSLNPAWKEKLSKDPEARWISVSPTGHQEGNTAIYATDFYITQDIKTATLKMDYSVDNYLGDWINDGIYLNGYQVPCAVSMGEYTREYKAECYGVENLLQLGTNTIYFYNINVSTASGIIFSIEIKINEPEDIERVEVIEDSEEEPRVLVAEAETEPEDEADSLPETGVGIVVFSLITFTGIAGVYIYQKSKIVY